MKAYLEKLLKGASITGSFEEGFLYAYEDFYIDDPIEKLKEFSLWIDKEIGGAGLVNISILWDAFNEPQDEELQEKAMNIRDRIAEIRGRMYHGGKELNNG